MIVLDDEVANLARVQTFRETFALVEGVQRVQTKQKLVLDEHLELAVKLKVSIGRQVGGVRLLMLCRSSRRTA